MTTQDYFSWLCNKVCLNEDIYNRYSKLLSDLYDIPYTVIPGFTVDEIRVRKTAELREEYTLETGILSSFNKPSVSCLEVLVSLAESVELTVMRDSAYGDRTHEWFWCMIDNLKLTSCDNEHYNKSLVWQTLENFVERRYLKDGTGSIAYTTTQSVDFRKLDIWQQFNIYISENYLAKENPNEWSNV